MSQARLNCSRCALPSLGWIKPPYCRFHWFARLSNVPNGSVQPKDRAEWLDALTKHKLKAYEV